MWTKIKCKLARWLLGQHVEEFMIIHIKTVHVMQEQIKELQLQQLIIAKLVLELKDQVPPKEWAALCQNAIHGLDQRVDNNAEALHMHQKALEAMIEEDTNITCIDYSDNN